MSDKINSSFLSLGVRYMLVATLFFTLMQTFVKELSDYHVFEVVFFRSSITAFFCMLYLRQKRISMIGKRQKFLILRSVFGLISMILFFVTIQRMPLGASVSLKYLSPMFTAIFAVMFLKEKIRPIKWLFFMAALGGVFLLKGFDTRIDTVTLLLGVTGAMFGGLVYVLIRRIGQSEHPMVIVNYFMLLAAVSTGIAMIPFWQTPNWRDLAMFLSIGTLGYFAQVYMTKSFQAELASKVAQIKYMELIYSLIIGFVWFGESYTLLGFLGILMILGSMLMNVMADKR